MQLQVLKIDQLRSVRCNMFMPPYWTMGTAKASLRSMRCTVNARAWMGLVTSAYATNWCRCYVFQESRATTRFQSSNCLNVRRR